MSIQEEQHLYTVTEDQDGVRFDKALSALSEGVLSRARIQGLIKGGHASVNNISETSLSVKVEIGDKLSIVVPKAEEAIPQAQDIPLDIVYEDGDLLVINKPIGLVVHPGAGNPDSTLVNALLHHCGDTLSGIGGVIRPGIVHRLDKDTSGLMVVAKNDGAHQGLSAQLSDRSLSRVYHALVLGPLMPPSGIIDKPIGRDGRNRQKMTVTGKNSREAITAYKSLHCYNDAVSLVECKLQTGRTHQIRVHMGHQKYPLVGDPLYGPQATALRAALKRGNYEPEDIESIMSFGRQALHAKAISFVHPLSGDVLSFESDYPNDISNALKILDK